MKKKKDIQDIPGKMDIKFTNLFNLDEIQQLQDLFSDTTGVASIITHPDGTPITRPSNFCRLCNDIIRRTEIGKTNCFKSDALIGRQNPSGPIIQPCLSGGLWDAGASISVGGKHVANWLIGQVRNHALDEKSMAEYANEIGAGSEEFMKALSEVPVMSQQQFEKVAQMLFVFANQLSEKAYKNLLYQRQMSENLAINRKLMRSEAHLSDIFNSVSEGIGYFDFRGRIVEMNRAFEEILGIPKEKLIGKHLLKIIPKILSPKSLKAVIPFVVDLIKMGKGGVLRFEYNDKLLEIVATINNDKNRIIGIVRDITQQTAAERKLEEERMLLRTLIDNIPDLIYSKDLQSRKTLANKAEIEYLGVKSEDELIGKDDFNFYPEEIATRFYEDDQKVIKTGNPVINREEFRFDKQGRKQWLLTTKIPLHDSEGKITGLVGIGRDITERREAEIALSESEKNFRTVVEEAVDTIYNINLDGYFTYVNPSGIKTSGYSLEELKHLRYIDLVDEGYREKVKRHYLKQYVTRVSQTKTEYPFRSKTGEIIWFSQNAKLVFEDGKPTGFFVISRDITETRKIQEALKESEARYRTFIDHVSEGIYRLEATTPIDISLPVETQIDLIYERMVIAECNELFLKMYGLTNREQMLGKSPADFHGGTGNETNRDSFRSFIANNYKVENVLTEESDVHGNIVYFNNSTIGIIENNHLMRIWGTQTDITSRIRTEKIQKVVYNISKAALSTADLKKLSGIIRDELSNLLDVTNFYIAFYDEKTGTLSTDYEIDEKDSLDSWPAEKSVSGYVIRNKKSALLTARDVDHMAETGELEIIGTPSKVWMGVPLWLSGKVVGVMAVQSYDNPDAYTEMDKLTLEVVANQISFAIERKLAEEELKKAVIKAQESEKLMSAFLANMSHEIRTPINGIIGFADLLKNPGLNQDDRMAYVDIIAKSGTRMLSIINDIIDYSKIESGLMQVHMAEVNINELNNFIYTFFKPEADNKGIGLRCKNSLPDPQAIVVADYEKLYAILINLIKNALKFTSNGSVEFGYKIKENKGQSFIEYFIKDTGAGIPPGRQAAIFERFVQADSSDKRTREGTGLGLPISKAYVEMMGGEIRVESPVLENGGGSGFYFTIPVKKEKAGIDEPLPSVEPAESNNDRQTEILIAEDDETSALLLSYIFKKSGFTLYFVKNGLDTVNYCRQHPGLALILMDIKMPVMDGYEATRQIRKFNKSVVIIALTAFAISGDREKAIKAGCNDHLTKPVKKENLKEMLEKYHLTIIR